VIVGVFLSAPPSESIKVSEYFTVPVLQQDVQWRYRIKYCLFKFTLSIGLKIAISSLNFLGPKELSSWYAARMGR
jgi:hypothetical protein